MYYALVYYPEITHPGFVTFRKKYEPYAALLPEHVTLVYPVEQSIGYKIFAHHIREILREWQPFDLHFSSRLELTWDCWMKLLAEEGYDQILLLHDQLYTGILEPHLRKDLPYNAYIGIGLFSNEGFDFSDLTTKKTLNRPKYDRAVQEFKQLDFDHWCTVDQLTIVEVNENFTECENKEIIRL